MKPALLLMMVLVAGCSSVPSDNLSTNSPTPSATAANYGAFPRDYEKQIMEASRQRWSWASERVLSASKPRRAQLKALLAATEYCYAVKFGLYEKSQNVSNAKHRKFMAIFEDGQLVRIDRSSDTWLTLYWIDPE